jgi:YVTN family beta-propeller protein
MKWVAATLVVAMCFLVARAKPPAPDPNYLSPGEIAVSSDGLWVYVVAERSDELLILNAQDGTIAHRIGVGLAPRGLSLSPDERQIYVTNSWSDTVSIVDAARLQVIQTVSTGYEPISAITDPEGKTLYVANRLSNDISVVDLSSGQEIKRLAAGRGASYLQRAPDATEIYCTHVYPLTSGPGITPESEITVIDTLTKRVSERKSLHNVAGVFHTAVSPDGKLGIATQLRPKNLIPLAHVEHGRVFGNSLALFGKNIDRVVQVPIDELDRYFTIPFGVAITPDASKVFISSTGVDTVTEINLPRLLKFTHAHPRPFINDLSASANYVAARIPVGRNPRGIALSRDGRLLYVANRMDDSISVISTATDKVIATWNLSAVKRITPLRRGEQIFYNSRYSFQGHFSCANCHIDATFDGLQWDLEPDGFGIDVVDNRSIEDLAGTQPYKWNGGNPDLPTECGPRTEKYFYRSQSYDQQELTDLVTFVLSLPLRPNRFRNHDLTPAQERGRVIFERAKTKTGATIPESNRCNSCHSGPKYTNQQQIDVATGKRNDRSPRIDVPQLSDVAYSAPYLHDGSAHSLEEIWTVFNPKDQHGVTNDLTKDELNDLIEYLRTL